MSKSRQAFAHLSLNWVNLIKNAHFLFIFINKEVVFQKTVAVASYICYN